MKRGIRGEFEVKYEISIRFENPGIKRRIYK